MLKFIKMYLWKWFRWKFIQSDSIRSLARRIYIRNMLHLLMASGDQQFFSSFHFIQLARDDGWWRVVTTIVSRLCFIIHREINVIFRAIFTIITMNRRFTRLQAWRGLNGMECKKFTIAHENSAKSLAIACELHAGMSVMGEITSKAPAVLNHRIPEAPIDVETTKLRDHFHELLNVGNRSGRWKQPLHSIDSNDETSFLHINFHRNNSGMFFTSLW